MAKKEFKDMTVFEQSRWYSLLDAVNLVSAECDRRGKNFDNIKISPLDVEKYIESTCDIYARKIEEERRLQISDMAPVLETKITAEPISTTLEESPKQETPSIDLEIEVKDDA